MSNTKGSGMTISNTGGKDFDPDPVLDPKGDYESRIVGFMHIGVHEKDIYIDGKPTGNKEEQNQAIVLFELTEEETFVERGPENDKKMVRRFIAKFLKYSSHEKSNLYGIAAAVGSDAAFKEKGEGRVDPVEMVGGCVSLKLALNKSETKNNVKSAVAIPKKYHADVPEAELPLFCYSVDQGAFVGTVEDVPPWMLTFATDHGMYVEKFEKIVEIEGQIAKNKEAKDAKDAERDKLAGDEKPADTSSKPSTDSKEEDKPATSRRRRGRGKAEEETVDYSGKDIEEMEGIVLNKGTSEGDLDKLADENKDDDDYLAALVALAKS